MALGSVQSGLNLHTACSKASLSQFMGFGLNVHSEPSPFQFRGCPLSCHLCESPAFPSWDVFHVCSSFPPWALPLGSQTFLKRTEAKFISVSFFTFVCCVWMSSVRSSLWSQGLLEFLLIFPGMECCACRKLSWQGFQLSWDPFLSRVPHTGSPHLKNPFLSQSLSSEIPGYLLR